MRKRAGFFKAVENIIHALCCLADVVLSCYVSFFVTLFMHSLEQDHQLKLMKKQRDAEMDVAIQTITVAITKLDNNIAMLKATTRANPEAVSLYTKELDSTERQRLHLHYLLTSLRGRLDVCRVLNAVNVISDHVGLQLDASSYINKKALTLVIQRDLGDKRDPVVEASVNDAYESYNQPRDIQLI